MNRRSLIFFRENFLVFALPLILAVVSGRLSLAADVTTVKLALNWKPEPQFGGFYTAELNGHYQREKLKVEIIPGGAGMPTVQMVAAGKVDFGIVSADEVVMSRSRGSDVVALFASYQTNPQGIMAHTEKNYHNLKALFADKDATVALQKGLPYAVYLQNLFGSPSAKLVPYQGGISAFLGDKNFAQQCFVTSEPLEARRRGLNPKVFLVADDGYNPYTTVLITRDEVAKSKNSVVRAMVAAVQAGWVDYLRDPTATNAKMAALNPTMDARTFKESAEAQKSLIETEQTKTHGIGYMSEDRWRNLTEQLLKLGVITKKPEVKALFVWSSNK